VESQEQWLNNVCTGVILGGPSLTDTRPAGAYSDVLVYSAGIAKLDKAFMLPGGYKSRLGIAIRQLCISGVLKREFFQRLCLMGLEWRFSGEHLAMNLQS